MAYALSYKTSKKNTLINLFYEIADSFAKLFLNKESSYVVAKKEDYIQNVLGLFGSKKKEPSATDELVNDTPKKDSSSSGGGKNPWEDDNLEEEDEEEEILRYRDAMLENQVNPVAKLRIIFLSSVALFVLTVVVAFQAIIYMYKPFSKIKVPSPLSSAIMVNSDGFTVYANNVDSDVGIDYVNYKDISYDIVETTKAYINIVQKEYDAGGTGTCSSYNYNFSGQLLCSNSFLFRLAEANIFEESNVPNWFKAVIVTALYYRYSEVEAIEIYLNTLRFNANVYGIKEASNVFFNKEPKDLNVIESLELISTARQYQNIPYNVYKISSKEALSMYLIENGKVLEDNLVGLRKYLEQDSYFVGSNNLYSHFETHVNFSSIFDVLNTSGGSINDVRIYSNLYQGLQNNIFNIIDSSLTSQESNSATNTASVVVLSGQNDVITSFTAQRKEDGSIKYHNGHPTSKPGYIIKPIVYSIVESYAYEIPQILKDSLITDMRNLVAIENQQMTIDEQIESSKGIRTSESYRKALRKVSTEVELQRLERDFNSMEISLPFVLPESVFEGYFAMNFEDVVKMYSMLVNGGFYNNYQYYNSIYIADKLNNIPPLPSRQILTEADVADIKDRMLLQKQIGSDQGTLYYTAGQNIAIGLYNDMVIGIWYGRIKNDLNNDTTRQNYAVSLETLFKVVDTIANTKPYAKINPEDVYSVEASPEALEIEGVTPEESSEEVVEGTEEPTEPAANTEESSPATTEQAS